MRSSRRRRGHAQDAVARGGRRGPGRDAVGATPRSRRSSRRPPRRSTAPSRRAASASAAVRSRPGTGSRSTSTWASRRRPQRTRRGPVIGIYHGWGGSKLEPLRRRRAARAHPRLRRVHDDRPRLGRLLRRRDAHRPALRRQGLHPPDAQRLRGARRAVRARPARRRRRDRPAADRRHRRLLRRRHVDRARRAAQPHRNCPTAS